MSDEMKTFTLTKSQATVELPMDVEIATFIDDDGGLVSVSLGSGRFCRHRLCAGLQFDSEGTLVNVISSKDSAYEEPLGGYDAWPVVCDVVSIDEQVFASVMTWLLGVDDV